FWCAMMQAANRAGRPDTLCHGVIAYAVSDLGGPGTARARGFHLLPPATTEAAPPEETPVHEEAPMTEATPGIGGGGPWRHHHGQNPCHTQDLGSQVPQGVCEDDGDNRQAPD